MLVIDLSRLELQSLLNLVLALTSHVVRVNLIIQNKRTMGQFRFGFR